MLGDSDRPARRKTNAAPCEDLLSHGAAFGASRDYYFTSTISIGGPTGADFSTRYGCVVVT